MKHTILVGTAALLLCLSGAARSEEPAADPKAADSGSSKGNDAGPAPADGGTDAEKDEAARRAELAKQLSNPVASLVQLPFKLSGDYGFGHEDAARMTVLCQPVIPFTLGKDWNLITRTIIPAIYAEPAVEGGKSFSCLADIQQSLFLSPAEPVAGWILAAGPYLIYPSATNDAVGSEKWSAGPTALALRQEGGLSFGLLANHAWSYAGANDRKDVCATFLQPFVSYALPTQTTITLNSESTYDWKAHRWTVPINLNVSQLLKIGGRLISIGGGFRYYAVKPEYGPEWGFSFTVSFLFPGK